MSMSPNSLRGFVALCALTPAEVPEVNLETKGSELLKKHPQLVGSLEDVLQPVAEKLQLSRDMVRRVLEDALPRLVEAVGKKAAEVGAQRHGGVGMGLPEG